MVKSAATAACCPASPYQPAHIAENVINLVSRLKRTFLLAASGGVGGGGSIPSFQAKAQGEQGRNEMWNDHTSQHTGNGREGAVLEKQL